MAHAAGRFPTGFDGARRPLTYQKLPDPVQHQNALLFPRDG